MTVPPNVKYQDRFLKTYREARERRRGFWQWITNDEMYHTHLLENNIDVVLTEAN